MRSVRPSFDTHAEPKYRWLCLFALVVSSQGAPVVEELQDTLLIPTGTHYSRRRRLNFFTTRSMTSLGRAAVQVIIDVQPQMIG